MATYTGLLLAGTRTLTIKLIVEDNVSMMEIEYGIHGCERRLEYE
jgi:hypothetical protein